MHDDFILKVYRASCKYEIGVFDRLLIDQNIWPTPIDDNAANYKC